MIPIEARLKAAADDPYLVFTGFSFILIIFGFIFSPLPEIMEGLYIIVKSPDILITDYIKIAGLGGAFVNSGIVMLMSVGLLIAAKHTPTRYTITSLMLAGGFAFFGKNPANMSPIILGGYLFSLYAHEPFNNNVLATLFGTTLAPVVTQVAYLYNPKGETAVIKGILAGIAIGVAVGFIIEPLAKNSIKSHEGYNLYNVGFAAGILGVVIMSVFRNFGIDFTPVSILSGGNDFEISLYIFCTSVYFLIIGFLHMGSLRACFHAFLNIEESSNYFTKIVGLDYLKMGIIGIFVTIYVRALGVDLNGPIIGGIFTVVGFSCSGKKIKTMIPVMLGASIARFLNIYDNESTVVMMAVLFSTCLSPIADKHGMLWGAFAGFIHIAVSLNIGTVNGGLNLYNNGLAGGFVVMTIVPLIRAFSWKKYKENAGS